MRGRATTAFDFHCKRPRFQQIGFRGEKTGVCFKYLTRGVERMAWPPSQAFIEKGIRNISKRA